MGLPLSSKGIRPVAEEEFKAWEAWLMKRALLATAPAPVPHAYAKLHSLVVRLWEATRDQERAIRGLQECNALMAKEVRQERLL